MGKILISGTGLDYSLLTNTTASEQDVILGKTFYSGNNIKKTGMIQDQPNWISAISPNDQYTKTPSWYELSGYFCMGIPLGAYRSPWPNCESAVLATDSNFVIWQSLRTEHVGNLYVFAHTGKTSGEVIVSGFCDYSHNGTLSSLTITKRGFYYLARAQTEECVADMTATTTRMFEVGEVISVDTHGTVSVGFGIINLIYLCPQSY